ncbi:MAG: dihydrofolate reductase family protein [Rhizobiales bacterium]|nr:dihydrofolate reductase family protein [Hyphomicrobiales bacterium]
MVWNLMTLDGYMEGPNHDLSFHSDVWGAELEQLSIAQLRAAGALMFGRRTHDLMASYWTNAGGEAAEVADFMNELPKFVFSRSVTQSGWRNVQVFGGDAVAATERLKRETDKDILIFGSADLASQLGAAGIIDEYRIGICPLLLGSGTPLFKQGAPQKLRLLEAKAYGTGIVVNRYAPQA